MSEVHFPIGGGGSGTAYAYIKVTYPAGSTCTCSKGTKTLTAKNTSGEWIFTIPEAGTWTVSCTDGTDTAEKTISISAQDQVELAALSYRLPSIYQEVEYIKATGSQSINLGAIIKYNSILRFKIKYTNFAGSAFIGNSGTYRFFAADGPYVYFDIGNNNRIQFNENGWLINKLVEVEIGNFYVKDISTGTVKGSKTALSSYPDTASTTNVDVFTPSDYGELYYLKVINASNQIVHDYIPCYRKSDNVAGLFDSIGRVFYTSTGTLIVGGNVT